jgi:hypothetical protein
MSYALEILPDTSICYFCWNGPITVNDRRNNIGLVIDYCRKNQIEKVIIDVSKQINLPESVDSFNLGVETAIRAKDFELGLLADTKSENLKLYVDTCASRGLTIELFYRFQDALNWLENQTPQS